MDFLISLGINAVLQLLADKKSMPKFYRALAKLYVAIETAAQSDKGLAEAIAAKKALL